MSDRGSVKGGKSAKGSRQQSARNTAKGSESGSAKGSERGSARGSERGSAYGDWDRETTASEDQRRKERRHRMNRIYRCPPTPTQEAFLEKEKSFVLDSKAVSSISTDYSKANPKLGAVIPPYNSHHDRHVTNYFTYAQVEDTLKKTDQIKETSCSIEGKTMDEFNRQGAGYIYLSLRNQNGAGHARETIDGHSQFMEGIKPVIGYNGRFGYRRTSPWLRAQPSEFGTASRSPCH